MPAGVHAVADAPRMQVQGSRRSTPVTTPNETPAPSPPLSEQSASRIPRAPSSGGSRRAASVGPVSGGKIPSKPASTTSAHARVSAAPSDVTSDLTDKQTPVAVKSVGNANNDGNVTIMVPDSDASSAKSTPADSVASVKRRGFACFGCFAS